MNSAGLSEILVLLCVASACLAAVLGVGAAGFAVLRAWQGRDAGKRLAEPLGLTLLCDDTGQSHGWYGGVHAGRRFALRAAGKPAAGSGGRRHALCLRLVMEVLVPRPLAITVATSGAMPPLPAESAFATVFVAEHAERLAPEARAALLAFAQAGQETAATAGSRWRSYRRLRDVRLSDRAEALGSIPAEALPDATVILAHDCPDPLLPAEEVRVLLGEMAAVAAAVENGKGAPAQVSGAV